MATATASRTRKAKSTAKGGKKATATAKRVVKTPPAQKSLTRKFDRGKLTKDGEWVSGEPSGLGGVCFTERASAKGATTLRAIYVAQDDDAVLGSPESLTVLITAGA